MAGSDPAAASWPVNGGELGQRIKAFDWSATSLGPISHWPQSLRTATDLLLRSQIPIVLLWGSDGVMIYNDAYSSFAGKRHPELLGSRVREGWAEVSEFNDNVMRVGLAGGTLSYRDQALTLDRGRGPEPVWMNLDYSPVPDESGQPAGVIAIVIETSESVRAKTAIAESEARFRMMADQAPVMMWVTEPSGVCTHLNRRWYEFTGQAEEAGTGFGWLDAVHPDDRPVAEQAFLDATRERRDYRVEFRLRRADGVYRWAIAAAAARVTGDGEFLGFIGSVIDIDERREVEQRLRESEARFRDIANSIDQMVWSTRPDGYHDFYNQRWYDFTGVPEGSTDGAGWNDMFHPDDQERAWARWAHCLATGDTYEIEYRLRHRSGAYRWVLGRAQPVRDDGGAIRRWYGTCTDIHDQKVAEAALRESRDQLASESHALEILNRTGTQVAAELGLESLVQRVVDAGVELTGAKLGAFFYTVVDQEGGAMQLFALAGADRSAFESFGMPRATAVFAPTFRGEGVIRSDDILRDPRYGRNAPHAGLPAGHLPVRSYLAVPVTSRSGEVIGGLFFGHEEPGMFTERSERVMTGLAAQAAIAIDNARLFDAVQRANAELEQRVMERTTELEQAHEALRQAQKMEAVGQLTGGIAHDFNNLLTGVIGSLDLLQRKIAAGRVGEIERHVSAAMTSANRAAALTHRLLAFARRQPLDPKPVNANRLVTSMEELLRRSIGENVQLEIVTAGGLWQTLCDPHQLESALLNLAINARDAMPDGGKLTIETCNAHLDSAYAAKSREVRPGQYVCICVSDTGTGMSRETIARAFEPFFTTKPIGQGTGLGLSMIYGFARQSDGYAKIYSEIGQGTTFKLYLPRFYGEGEEAEHVARADLPFAGTGSGEVILVVEDENAVRDLVTEVLGDMGYATIEAIDGPSGLRILESERRIDLLVTDVGLPGLNGRQLADGARQRRPDLKVLFMTGYAENAAINGGFLDAGMELITKPFAIEAFVQKLRGMMQE